LAAEIGRARAQARRYNPSRAAACRALGIRKLWLM